MRNRNKIRAGPFTGRVQPGPQVFRKRAVDEAERLVLLRHRRAGIGYDDAVQVCSSGNRTPLPADKCGEFSGAIVGISGIGDLAPGGGLDPGQRRYPGDIEILLPRQHTLCRCRRVLRGRQAITEQLEAGPAIDTPAQDQGRHYRLQALDEPKTLTRYALIINMADDAQVFRVV